MDRIEAKPGKRPQAVISKVDVSRALNELACRYLCMAYRLACISQGPNDLVFRTVSLLKDTPAALTAAPEPTSGNPEISTVFPETATCEESCSPPTALQELFLDEMVTSSPLNITKKDGTAFCALFSTPPRREPAASCERDKAGKMVLDRASGTAILFI